MGRCVARAGQEIAQLLGGSCTFERSSFGACELALYATSPTPVTDRATIATVHFLFMTPLLCVLKNVLQQLPTLRRDDPLSARLPHPDAVVGQFNLSLIADLFAADDLTRPQPLQEVRLDDPQILPTSPNSPALKKSQRRKST
jgi:hypothetical protein